MSFSILPPQTVQSAYDAVVFHFENSDIHFGQGAEDELDEAFWLIQHITQIPFEELESHADDNLSDEAIERIEKIVIERTERKVPLAYILGKTWFAGLSFNVSEKTIIPRSHLVEWIEEGFSPWLNLNKSSRVLDMCCGSGCIGIAIAHYLDVHEVDLVDISEDALNVAQINIKKFALNKRVKTIKSDLFEQIDTQYDLIVCNPPYVSDGLMEQFPEEFRYEPKKAHWGGEDGLLLVKEIIRSASSYLSADGALIMELGSAAPILEETYPAQTFQWMTSHSGENVVLIAGRAQLEAFSLVI